MEDRKSGDPWLNEQAPMPKQVQKRRLSAAMREVIERLVTTDAPEAELRAVADRLEDYAAHLRTHPRRARLEGFAESANAGGERGFFDYSPLIGLSNPLAPPIRLEERDGAAVGQVRFGHAYEGPPGHVHGGFIAAAFDEVLGYAQSLTGSPGMTGTLTVVYRAPTPLHTDLRYEGRVDRVEGRKIFAAATLHAGEQLCAQAEGIFISFDREHFLELAERAARAARSRG
jgi:acyl-coenzyme A thioesterase PaaI-like protein